MAVKAKAEITLSRIIDIESVTRYYLLQSSTASVPSKPTANPPGGNWKTTEPSYASGSTNTLYFVDLTVMTNGTFSYSTVSKSSSYEAAKEAWNKANNAQNSIDNLQDAITASNTAMDQLTDRVDARITATETDIDTVNRVISNLVVDKNGGSLMKQTDDGWVFSMAEIMGQVQQATDDLKTLEGNLDDQGGSIDALQNAVNALETLTSYVRITTKGDEPCIELGNHGSFKVRITNTSIDFMDGTSIPAYINNQSLKIDKAEVENELAFGKFAFKERDNGNMGLIWKG